MTLPNICKRGYLQINLSAIRSNIHNLHKRYPESTKILIAIKADGYGHGAKPIGQAIENMDCLYGYAVATSEEAFELRECGIKKPILIMGYVFPYAYERLITEEIAIILYNEENLAKLNDCAARLKKTVSVHIEVDTGMNRVGIKPDESGFSLIKKITSCPNIKIDGFYTHFARADEKNKEHTLFQLDSFHTFLDYIENELGLNISLIHSSNSAGMLGYFNRPLNICRPGIAVYGICPSKEAKQFQPEIELIPALSMYSRIIMLKDVPSGEPVSYGGSFVTARPTKIATIPIGYGDGYPRSLSNLGYVLIRGKKAPIIGRICMDFFMVDATDIPAVREGDKVTLIGNDGDVKITVEELSEISGRFHYEMVCGFGERLPRVYIKK